MGRGDPYRSERLQVLVLDLQVILGAIFRTHPVVPVVIGTFNLFIFFNFQPAINESRIHIGTFQVNLVGIAGNLNIAADLFDLTMANNNGSILDEFSGFRVDHGMGQRPHARCIGMNIFHRFGL